MPAKKKNSAVLSKGNRKFWYERCGVKVQSKGTKKENWGVDKRNDTGSGDEVVDDGLVPIDPVHTD